MATYRVREKRLTPDGHRVLLAQDKGAGGWFVGRRGDPALDPIPLGAFCSREAARRYADHRFPGGLWCVIS